MVYKVLARALIAIGIGAVVMGIASSWSSYTTHPIRGNYFPPMLQRGNVSRHVPKTVFRVHDVDAEVVKGQVWGKCDGIRCGGEGFEEESGLGVAKFSNGFIGGIVTAYADHHSIALRPDDIWVAILHGFRAMMVKNDDAERLRQHFVDFDGKQTIHIRTGGALDTYPIPHVLELFSNAIEERTLPGVRDWIVPNFTTTTPETKAVAQVAMMAVLQDYFKYKWTLGCGIPTVTLYGSPEDWSNVRARAQRLRTFGYTEWHDLLDPVLAQFEQAAKGHIDTEFWHKIVRKKEVDVDVVCATMHETHISGWLNVFLPAQATKPSPEHPWGEVDTETIPVGYLSVPVEVCDNSCGHKTEFQGGFFGTTSPDPTTIQPALSWRIKDTEEPCIASVCQ